MMSGKTRIKGMGAIPHTGGIAFRVWAPHAQQVSVIGSFNDSAGNAIVHDTSFDWKGDDFQLAPWNELVIYELHIGTFNEKDDTIPGKFAAAGDRLGHLKKLGVNAVQIMPISEYAGKRSWGYNPSHSFSVETGYGGPLAFKRFVKRAHEHDIAVILDVVYNHLGPSDLDLWQFDGWSDNNRGGIYFYNDERARTPWGETRPDYGRGEVRQFILDNATMWLEEYHVDGLRFDGTVYIRTPNGPGSTDLPDGWSLLQAINALVARKFPGRITIAEDLQNNEWLTKDVVAGGAGFGAQWDANFVHPIRQAVITPQDDQRSLAAIRDALCYRYNDDAFERVIYSESHDEVANGRARVPQEVNPGDPEGWYAQKRSTLAAVMVLTAPGIPMLFQGQEFLEGGWFRDTVPLDWDRRDQFRGIVRLYRDLIRLRLNHDGCTRGLCGQFTHVHHVNDQRKVVAFHRWDKGGPADSVVVVANFLSEPQDGYVIGFPAAGSWQLRFNSDKPGYSEAFKGHPSTDVVSAPGDYDGFPCHATLSIGPYSALIFSQ